MLPPPPVESFPLSGSATITMTNNFPKGRVCDLVVQELPDEVLVYDLKSNKAACLNQAAAGVWRECDGTRNVGDIAAIISAKTGVQVDESFIWLALESLDRSNLLENKIEIPTNRISRRKAIVSYAAMAIALPLVTTLVAPHSAHAQSTGTCFVGPAGTVSCTVGVTDCNADQGAGGVCPAGCSCGGAICIPNGGSPCCTVATNQACA